VSVPTAIGQGACRRRLEASFAGSPYSAPGGVPGQFVRGLRWRYPVNREARPRHNGRIAMRFSRKLTALSIALVVCGTASCTDLEGTWSLLSFTIYPPSGAPVEMKGRGTLSFDDFGYVMMTLDADAASAALLTEAGIPIEKNRFVAWGTAIVDKRSKTLKYVKYAFEGQYPAVTAGPAAVERLCYWNVTGSTLTLTMKDESGKPLSIGRWRRQFTNDPGLRDAPR
jgi:hypothetical protein